MASSMKLYIQTYLRNGTALGIVTFASSATTKLAMTSLSSSSARSAAVSRVPTIAKGGTGIGGGLQKCQTVSGKSHFLIKVSTTIKTRYVDW